MASSHAAQAAPAGVSGAVASAAAREQVAGRVRLLAGRLATVAAAALGEQLPLLLLLSPAASVPPPLPSDAALHPPASLAAEQQLQQQQQQQRRQRPSSAGGAPTASATDAGSSAGRCACAPADVLHGAARATAQLLLRVPADGRGMGEGALQLLLHMGLQYATDAIVRRRSADTALFFLTMLDVWLAQPLQECASLYAGVAGDRGPAGPATSATVVEHAAIGCQCRAARTAHDALATAVAAPAERIVRQMDELVALLIRYAILEYGVVSAKSLRAFVCRTNAVIRARYAASSGAAPVELDPNGVVHAAEVLCGTARGARRGIAVARAPIAYWHADGDCNDASDRRSRLPWRCATCPSRRSSGLREAPAGMYQ